ncbi:hypothetical protein WN943_010282 [Citrus x changshan-huyou]
MGYVDSDFAGDLDKMKSISGGKDKGCNGDLIDNVFQFIQNNKVITTEINYPYKGVDRKCNAKEKANHAAKINGHKDVLANSETTLMKAIVNQPILVAIDA